MRDDRKVVLIDYGGGNIRSVAKAINHLGYSCKVSSEVRDIQTSGAVILPGVGSARDTMSRLRALNMVEPLQESIGSGRPFLGICIGLQVLLTDSEESIGDSCLNIIEGRVKKLPDNQKVPHMGWNQVKQKIEHPLFDDIPDDSNFYFVHSYYVDVQDKSIIAAETNYGITFPCIIIKDNMVATQFHLEKSGQTGLKMCDNFLKFALNK